MPTHVIPLKGLFVHSNSQLGIPGLATDELRIAFLQATASLCPDVQRKIWEEVIYCTEPIEPPPTPQKCSKISYTRYSASLPQNLLTRLECSPTTY